jgi:hypothetical protein
MAELIDPLSDVIGTLIGALIALIGTWVGTRNSSRHREHELFIQSLALLTGGSQTRNVGISAIGLFLEDERYYYRSRSALIGSAIYLLVESGQGDKRHELYNLSRIMDLLVSEPSRKRRSLAWPWQSGASRRHEGVRIKGLEGDYAQLLRAVEQARNPPTPTAPKTIDAGEAAKRVAEDVAKAADKSARRIESDSEGKQRGVNASKEQLETWEHRLRALLHSSPPERPSE